MPDTDFNLTEEFELRSVEFKINCDDGDGDALACHSLGEWYSVVKNDHEQAADIYKKNCDKNKFGASCFNLARLYLAGKGVEQDDAAAARLSQKACDNKHTQVNTLLHLKLERVHGRAISFSKQVQ
jgi:TPR repeat protein